MTNKSAIKQASRAGRKPSLNAQHIEVLRAITQEQPRSSLEEVTRELDRRTGVQVNPVTVRKALREAGIERLKPLRRASERAAVQGSTPARYGYTDAHRRRDGASGMNTDLTDAEWALVRDLFERDGQRGAPPRFERRLMLNACCYALRTGCAWRLLPKSFPPWQAVYMAFKRWAAAGLFEAMHDRLRQQWRQRMGRSPEPSAAIIDAQSTRSSAQGGDTGFDAGKKVKGRKRHLVVDTLGLLLAVTVTAASVQDRDAAAQVVAQACTKVAGLKNSTPTAPTADGAHRPSSRPMPSAWRWCATPVTAARALGKTRSSRCGPRWLPRASWCRPSAGSWSARTPGTSARAGSLPITIAPDGPRWPGCGWLKRVSLQADWPGKTFRLHPLSSSGR